MGPRGRNRAGRVIDQGRALLIGSSVYERDEMTGRVAFSATRTMEAVLGHNAFMQSLPYGHRAELMEASVRRVFARKDQLRGSSSSMVHIVLSGCVAEGLPYGDATAVRILGAGALLGDLEVFDPTLATPTTRCLNGTWTMTIPMDRMRVMAQHNSALAMAIGNSITGRLMDTERIYNRPGLRPEERLAGLFVHLLNNCAVPCPDFGRMVEGPSQGDLAEALSISRATTEAALRTLRERGLIVTGYRTFRFPSESALADLGKVRIPVQRVTGEASR